MVLHDLQVGELAQDLGEHAAHDARDGDRRGAHGEGAHAGVDAADRHEGAHRGVVVLLDVARDEVVALWGGGGAGRGSGGIT